MPKRHDDLFRRIANFGAIRAAARSAVCGKRKKPGASAFFANLEPELLRLERELQDGTYRPGRYVEIKVCDPKERIVSAAPFRDRVVHHALCAVIGPLFERGFIGNTFANRVGKGTHRAVTAYEAYRDRHAHVLRCDLYRYFPSIDHAAAMGVRTRGLDLATADERQVADAEPRPRPSSVVGTSTGRQPRHAVVADDPSRADRWNAVARRVLPGLRHEPGDRSSKGRPPSPRLGRHPRARPAVLVLPGIGAHAEDPRAAYPAAGRDCGGIETMQEVCI
jgi:hypothetical protein